jgi:hypothetical protein
MYSFRLFLWLIYELLRVAYVRVTSILGIKTCLDSLFPLLFAILKVAYIRVTSPELRMQVRFLLSQMGNSLMVKHESISL